MDDAGEELVVELSKKQKKNIERKQRQEVEQAAKQKQAQAAKIKQTALLAALAIGGLALVYFLVTAPKAEGPYTPGKVHWHAALSLSACGERIPFPSVRSGQMLGPEVRHLHDDNDAQIHIEDQVWRKEDIMVGAFLSDIGVPFDDKQVGRYKEGDACPNGTPGKINFTVNGAPNNEYARHVMQDGDRMEIKFE